jgi:hypothetical protein
LAFHETAEKVCQFRNFSWTYRRVESGNVGVTIGSLDDPEGGTSDTAVWH